jgi:outer membrane protein assembly factor BamB
MELLNKKIATMFAIILLFASLLLISAPNNAGAVDTSKPFSGALPSGVTANVTAKSYAALSVRPNPVGVNQHILINFWVAPAPAANRMFLDLTVTITKPDGTTEVIKKNSYPADGTAYIDYQVNQVGEWKFKMDFPGTYLPAGRYLNGELIASNSTLGTLYTESVYMQPSSTPEQTITVQQDMVVSWIEDPLPTDYWTRPVAYERREWWSILGNFPWRGQTGGPMWDELYPDTNPYWMSKPRQDTFIPWVEGPESAHVAWKRYTALGGIIGGDYGYEANTQIFQGNGLGADAISSYGFPAIVLAGRAYEVLTQPLNGVTQPQLSCYDIRTGEVYWNVALASASVAPNVIEYAIGQSPGGGGDPTHVTGLYLDYIGGGRLIKWDPVTGAITGNYSISPLTTGTYYTNGYALSVQDLGAAAGANRYRLINWTTLGTLANLTTTTGTRIVSNITWPVSSLPSVIDFQAGVAVNVATISRGGIYVAMNAYGIDINTGALLWNITREGETPYSGNTNVADHGKLAILTEQGYFLALNIRTGVEVWKSERFAYPWDDAGFGAYDVQTAYGLLYRAAYSGIYAFNWDDGSIEWKFEAPAANPYETPYINEKGETVYSWNIGARIADGKYYTYTIEHSATVPITRGWKTFCIDAKTGEEVWSTTITGAMSKHTTSIGPIVDGYMVLMSSDGYTYSFGKGQSETTVSAPQTQITAGQKAMITGTVLDLSPAQPGTACVSDASMGEWMAHIHKGLSIPANVTGVPVSIDAVDPNGNYVHLGDAVSDMSGTYAFEWQPTMAGQYTITATFMGTASYGSSYGQTYAVVVDAPATPEPSTSTTTANPPYELYTVGTGIAVIIAVALVGLLLLRKKA